MPYGDLIKQNVMRFEKYEDLDKYDCTIEEREEYEPYIEQGLVIYSGVDYEKIIREAEKEADVVILTVEIMKYRFTSLICFLSLLIH
jgi:predicted GTPase